MRAGGAVRMDGPAGAENSEQTGLAAAAVAVAVAVPWTGSEQGTGVAVAAAGALADPERTEVTRRSAEQQQKMPASCHQR